MLTLEEPFATQARILHLGELIELFRGYMDRLPIHAEYYASVITHLEVLREERIAYLEKLECPTLH